MKSERVQLVITVKDRRAWTAAARRNGLSLNEFVRQQVNAALETPATGGARVARTSLRAVRAALEAAERMLDGSRRAKRRSGARQRGR